MKKLLAFTLSLVMSAAFLTACGDDDSSSKKDKDSSSSTSSSAAADSDSSKADDASSAADADSSEADTDASSDDATTAATGDGALTKAYTEKMASGDFAVEMKAEVMGMETNLALKKASDDMYCKLDLFGETIEIYKVGDTAVAVLPSEKKYGEVPEEQLASYTSSVSTYTLDENATFVGSAEEDGMTVETFKVPLNVELGEGVTMESSEDNDTEMKYYFDADGNLKKVVSNSPMVGETTVEITSLSFEDVKIELPDLSDYEKVEQGETAVPVESEAE